MIGSGDQAAIQNVLSSFAKSNEQLINSLIQLQYYMRGAVNRDEVWALSPSERELYFDFISKRFEEGGKMMKHGVPVFL